MDTNKIIKIFLSDYRYRAVILIIAIALALTINSLAQIQPLRLVVNTLDATENAVVEISPNGRFLLIGTSNRLLLRDFTDGKEEWRTESASKIKSAKFSPDGAYILIIYGDKRIGLWDTDKGREIFNFAGHNTDIVNAGISPDGKTIITVDQSGKTIVWDIYTRTQLLAFEKGITITTVTFAPDHNAVLTGDTNGKTIFWNLDKNDKRENVFYTDGFPISAVSFSSISLSDTVKSSYNILSSSTTSTRLFDVKTSREILKFNQSSDVTAVASASSLQTDNSSVVHYVVTGSNDGISRLWKFKGFTSNSSLPIIMDDTEQNSTSGNYSFIALKGHTAPIKAVSISGDRKFVFTYSIDRTVRIWNIETGKELCRVYSFHNGDWAVVDKEGRFDSSNGGEINYIYWELGSEKLFLSELKDEYYEPNLLTRVLSSGKPRAVVPLKDVKLPPKVIEQKIEPDSTILSIKLQNRGGGFGVVQVFVNDKLAIADARDEKLKNSPNASQEFAALLVDLKDSAFVNGQICEKQLGSEKICHENEISVVTSNYIAEINRGNINSRGIKIEWKKERDSADKFQFPTLYAIIGGVSDYGPNVGNTQRDPLDLSFADKDAEAFANALKLGAERLFCEDKPNDREYCNEKVQIKILNSSGKPGTISPTKENFRQEFARIAAKAKPEDTVVVYLSGHGVSLDNTDTYLYLTQNSFSTSKDDLVKDLSINTISSDELLCWLTTTPCKNPNDQLQFEGKPQLGTKALKQVIILDTCAAGKAGQILSLTSKKELTIDQRRAIEFLKDKSGTHILMGSTADQPSYEASQYGQGVLTRALLQGIAGAALQNPNNFIDVRALFGYAEGAVPDLAKNIGGIQRPTIASPPGSNTFLIGRITVDDGKNIFLSDKKPYVLRPKFGNLELGNRDNRYLSDEVSKLLNDENISLLRRGNSPFWVYLNEENFPKAIQITGLYTESESEINIEVFLWQDDKKIVPSFKVKGSKNMIAQEVLDAIKDKLTNYKP